MADQREKEVSSYVTCDVSIVPSGDDNLGYTITEIDRTYATAKTEILGVTCSQLTHVWAESAALASCWNDAVTLDLNDTPANINTVIESISELSTTYAEAGAATTAKEHMAFCTKDGDATKTYLITTNFSKNIAGVPTYSNTNVDHAYYTATATSEYALDNCYPMVRIYNNVGDLWVCNVGTVITSPSECT